VDWYYFKYRLPSKSPTHAQTGRQLFSLARRQFFFLYIYIHEIICTQDLRIQSNYKSYSNCINYINIQGGYEQIINFALKVLYVVLKYIELCSSKYIFTYFVLFNVDVLILWEYRLVDKIITQYN